MTRRYQPGRRTYLQARPKYTFKGRQDGHYVWVSGTHMVTCPISEFWP